MSHKDILEAINLKGGLSSYKASTDNKNPWNLAFQKYNESNSRPLRKGCEDCRLRVYNWLVKKSA